MTPDPNLVSAYWTYWRLSTSDDRDTRKEAERDWSWAWDAVEHAVEDAVAGNDDDIVPLLIALADAVADDEAALCYLGAGPIEDLLRHRGPPTPKLVDRLEGAAHRNPSFRIAVRCVWWGDEDAPELMKRFQKFGPPL